jgi:acyl-CoA synthetase (NDP forming)
MREGITRKAFGHSEEGGDKNDRAECLRGRRRGWRANYSFTPFFGGARRGKVALVSQSGGICHYLLHNSDIGFSRIIHLGNRCDVDFHDVMNFLSKDPETEVVAIYVEGLENGRAFYEELKKLVRVKRVVVMKAGRSRVADKASLSHTGSLAGDFEVFRAAVKQAGAIFVETPTELVDVAKILERFPEISGGIAIVTIQAGLGIVASDLIEENGGRLAELEDRTKEELKRLLPPLTMRENPIDLSFTGLDFSKTRKVLELLEDDKTVGVIVFLYAVAPPAWVIPASVLKDVLNGLSKPVIIGYFSTPEDFESVSKELKDISIVFSSLERLLTAVARISSSQSLVRKGSVGDVESS